MESDAKKIEGALPPGVEREYRYEWNWAYRIDHWLRAAAIFVLAASGFYIYRPFAGAWESQPAASVADAWLVMAWMRFAHFVAAYVLILGLVVRVYLAFNSRFDADWRDFGLLCNLRDAPQMIKYYLFLSPSHKPYRRYNPLQAMTYLLWAVLIVVQALTGFALYEGNVFGLFPSAANFLWVQQWLGGNANTRLLHYLITWVFLITAAVHVYMAVMVSWTQRDHSFRAMFTGYVLKRRGEP
ncbi:MAG TPA: Ni/Fe-hydrogenase, b-type cytochrome subunit [Pirellulales bacterium]|nr:Ni/Fe-hydrogenase, b-type cytochrome subunit [Pirellulales bacterium]